MKRALRDSVVVLTGASSGIGREAALQFAKEGCKLVLAARDASALDEVARLCNELGGEAIAVRTDVSDNDAVRRLRDAAVARFGRIDVWVNDAAAYMMGSVESTPAEVYKRLFETNVLGVVHGTKAALEEMRKRNEGVIINVGSLAGKSAYAEASAYCASKHAVHAFTEALRQELVSEKSKIEACIVAPGTVDTPLFQHAANYTGQEIEAMKPIYSPARVAHAIVRCAKHPRREVLVGAMPKTFSLMQMLLPGIFERVQPKMIESDHLGDAPVAKNEGNLYVPTAPHEVSGGWKQRKSVGFGLFAAFAALALPAAYFGAPRARRLLSS